MAELYITTQDHLPGPDGDEPYTMFVNQTEFGIGRSLRTNVLSARPDIKKFTCLRFRQTAVKRTPMDNPAEPEIVLVFLTALDLQPPLEMICGDIHLEMENFPIEEGAVIEVPLLPPGVRAAARGFA